AWATYTPDGDAIVAGGGDNIHTSKGLDGSARVAEWDARTGRLVGPPVKLSSFTVIQVAANRDGTRVIAGLADKQAAIVDPITGRILHMLDLGPQVGGVFATAFSP